jgi:hypothetical protein
MLRSASSCLALALLAFTAQAATTVNTVAGLANPLEKAGASARALGMGSAFVGVADDASALFWNPAGLSGLQGLELALHHNSALAGIIQESAVLGLPLGALGGLAVSLNYIGYGSLEGYDESGFATDPYSADRFGLGAGWGLQLLPGLSAGAGVKGTLQSVADASYSTVALDLGLLYALDGLRLGLSLINVGTPVAGYTQAAAIRLGASYPLSLSQDYRALLAAAVSIEPSGVNRLQVGLENVYLSMLAMRLGYEASLADTQIQGLSGLSAGLGVLYKGIGLDYAFLPYGDLGITHRLSLSYSFAKAGNAHD